MSPLQRLAAALASRDFRVLWVGAMTSSVGTWMQKVAQNWLVLTLAGASSAFYLGLDSFLGELPILLFTLVGGVVADRYDRRRLLVTSQFVQMSAAFALALLVYLGFVRIWHVLVLSALTGFAQAFGGPAYQSLIPLLVEKNTLPNAIALNSIQFNVARVIGPLVAGATLAAFGMVACFGLNGLSFLAVIVAILSLHTRHVPVASGWRMRDDLQGGFAYVRAQKPLIALILVGFTTTFLGYPLLTFLPLFAQRVFEGDVGLYTHLMAFAGAGAVAGALVVAWMGYFAHMGRTLLTVQFAYGVVVVVFAASRLLWLSELLLVGAGALLVMTTSLTTSLAQLIAPNEMRGRVLSIYLVAFRGGMPLGSLVAGWAANQTSAPAVLTVNGIVLGLVAGWFLVRAHGLREL
ncbi:MAG: MFS transporter [Vicinamibacterales bacterium]